MTENSSDSPAPDEQQVELDRDQAIADLGQAVSDREQQSSDHEQDRTDRKRDELASDTDDGKAPRDGSTIRAAQERRDAHQQLLDDAQTAREREQLTLDGQQDDLDDTVVGEALDTVTRRYQFAETRAAASEQRAEAAIRRARQARTRSTVIAQLEEDRDPTT